MKTPMTKTLITLVCLWLLCCTIRFLFYHEINESLWVLSLLIDGALALGGVTLTIILLFQKQRNAYLTAGAILGVIGLGWFTPLGWKAGTFFRMWRMESTYQAEVDRIMALDATALESLKGPAEVDEGPPRRIAFVWGGIIDNWNGIVYDPTGDVLIARQFKSNDSTESPAKQAEIRSLFGGDLQNAHHLWGDWYYCVFT